MKVMRSINIHLWNVLMVVLASVLGFSSCTDPGTTDKTDFIIYYSGMTDIGPSQSGTIAQPTYKGPTPSNFAITSVTLDGEPFTGDLFTIDGNTGAISVQSDESTSIGLYSISVSCEAGGSVHSYPDIVQVNFLKAVPEGITIDPSTLVVEYADIVDELSPVELPTAQVKTEEDHISITGYKISNVHKGDVLYDNKENPLFSISKDGVISIVKGCQAVEPGIYVLDLKLNTAIVGSESEEGFFANALEVKVVSKPLELTYPDGKIEQATDENPETEFISQLPTLKGSLDGISYSIASVLPEEAASKFTIDQTTGVITVAKGHGFLVGQTYNVSIKVANDYSKEGVLFENAFKLNVVDYIEPISGFSYDVKEATQAVKFVADKTEGFKGADPRFEFVDLDPKYKNILKLDPKTGAVSAEKGNNLELGQHVVKVKASNDKNSEVATLTINVSKNPNYFSYITYGNNLGLDERVEASQFRIYSEDELRGLKLEPKSDIPSGRKVKWKLAIKSQMKIEEGPRTSIDESTGKISALGLQPNAMGILYVTATVYGESVDEPEAYSVTIPVCFHHSAPTTDEKPNCKAGVTVEYTPFVFRVSPKDGGRSVAPKINGVDDISKFKMDYVRNYNYYNLEGYRTEGDGTPFEDGRPDDKINPSQFMKNLWLSCGITSYGAKDPVSYYGKLSPSATLCYVDNGSDYAIQVNANKWYDQGWADGLFACQICCVTKGEGNEIKGKGYSLNPIVIWLDKDME